MEKLLKANIEDKLVHDEFVEFNRIELFSLSSSISILKRRFKEFFQEHGITDEELLEKESSKYIVELLEHFTNSRREYL